MRNLHTVLTRLGAVSLAASMMFSVVFAAGPARKDRAKEAILHALVQHAAESKAAGDAATTRTNSITDNTVIGSNAANKSLTVYGTGRFGDEVAIGAISDSSSTPGVKYIIGAQAFSPKTNQIEVTFKNKGKSGTGAWVALDFVGTATRRGLTDRGVVNVGLRAESIYCHPQMSAAQVMKSPGAGDGITMKQTTTYTVQNNWSGASDFRLTPTVRVEAITNNIAFGVVPAGITTTNGTSGYYDSGYVTNNSTNYYTFNAGTLFYRVAGDNVASVDVVSAVTDSIEVLDVFSLFTDAELEELLAALNEYFGNDVAKVREYLKTQAGSLGRVLRVLRS